MKILDKIISCRNISMLAFSAFLIVSCGNENAVEDNKGMQEVTPGVSCEIVPFENEGEVLTRSTVNLVDGKIVFSWDSSDHLSIFAEGETTICDYSLQSIIRPDYAKFTGGGFELTKDKRYFALSKTENTGNRDKGTSIPDMRNITLSYDGQRMTSNGSTAHLGAYDYMTSSCICEATGSAQFTFKHLGSILRLVFKPSDDTDEAAAFNETEFTSVEMYDSENSFLKPLRPFSFYDGLSPDGTTYNQKWADPGITSSDKRISIALGTDAEHGITPSFGTLADNTTSSGKILVVYIMIPPTDFRNKTIGFVLNGKNGEKFYSSYVGYQTNMGKVSQMTMKPTQSTDFKVTLKVNHLWQHGYTLDNTSAGAKTRATGDPGNDDVHADPTNLYYFFCIDGKVIKKDKLTGGKWVPNSDNTICTYSNSDGTPKTLTLQVDKASIEDIKTARLYVVAGNRDLTTSTAPAMDYASITEGAENSEDAVKALTYNIISDDQTTTQAFMRDLYSTPWESNATFVGALTDPMQDVILYHTAAKVDLKWNSSAILSDNVSVNNVKSTKLSLFKPTNNSSAETANYTVTKAIDEENWVNGRQVFYLPQFNTYNVTIGSNTQNVTFSPTTTNGFTSWLRWLKNY